MLIKREVRGSDEVFLDHQICRSELEPESILIRGEIEKRTKTTKNPLTSSDGSRLILLVVKYEKFISI